MKTIFNKKILSLKKINFIKKNKTKNNSLIKEKNSFQLYTNNTFINSHIKEKEKKELSKNTIKQTITPKKKINQTEITKKYYKIYPILKKQIINHFKEKSYNFSKNNSNLYSNISNNCNIKSNKSISPFVVHSEKRRYVNSQKIKKNPKIKEFKFNTLETKETEISKLVRNKCKSYKKQIRTIPILDNYYNNSINNKKKEYNLIKNNFQKNNRTLFTETRRNFTKKYIKINTENNTINKKLKSISFKNSDTSLNKIDIIQRKKIKKKLQIKFKKKENNNLLYDKVKKKKKNSVLNCNKEFNKNLYIPYDIFINIRNKKNSKFRINKIIKTNTFNLNKDNTLFDKLDKIKKRNKYSHNDLKKYNTSIDNNNKNINLTNKLNEKNKNEDLLKNKQNIIEDNNSLKKLLEVFTSITSEKIKKEKSENESMENKITYVTNKCSEKKLDSLLNEIKRMEKEKKKIIEKKSIKEVKFIMDNNKKINSLTNNSYKNSLEYLKYKIEKKIEIIKEESNMRIDTYNKYFEFIFDILNQINKLSNNIKLDPKKEKEEKNKNNIQNNLNNESLFKSIPINNMAHSNSNSSSLFISSLNDDFYKKILDITKSIISSSKTIKMNENLNESSFPSKSHIKNFSPQIKRKNKNLFSVHPNDILDKLKHEYKTDYKKCKYNSHLIKQNNNNISKKNNLKYVNNDNKKFIMTLNNNTQNNCLIS